MENKAVESYSEITGSPKPGQDAGVPDPIPQALKRAVAVYEAGKALIAYITPDFEEIARVGGLWSGGARHPLSWICTTKVFLFTLKTQSRLLSPPFGYPSQ